MYTHSEQLKTKIASVADRLLPRGLDYSSLRLISSPQGATGFLQQGTCQLGWETADRHNQTDVKRSRRLCSG